MKFVISHMTVEGRENHPGVDTRQPRFGWWIHSDRKGLLQKAYRIIVKKDDLKGDVVWDSGRVESDVSYQIPYGGRELLPETGYLWQLMVWNRADEVQESYSRFDITYVRVVEETVSGRYSLSWERLDRGYGYRFRIPGGRRARVELPMEKNQVQKYLNSRQYILDGPFMEDVVYRDGKLCFTALPGEYAIS